MIVVFDSCKQKLHCANQPEAKVSGRQVCGVRDSMHVAASVFDSGLNSILCSAFDSTFGSKSVFVEALVIDKVSISSS